MIRRGELYIFTWSTWYFACGSAVVVQTFPKNAAAQGSFAAAENFKGGMCDGPKEGPVTRNKT
ncbi:MAG: hypothetical protein EGQ41_02435 [Clostridiales bacterium]|nr:hypothetical protein [Clostridiales bacterium]